MRTGNHNELTELFGVYYEKKSLENFDDLKEIISGPAYRDMTPRHLKGIGKNPDGKKELFENLADEFVKYFKSPPKSKEEFDEWHSKICNKVLETLDGLCEVKVHYGKAQKLVNMSFKNFYCFADAEEYEKKGYFDNCHMPLDSFTLSWYMNKADGKISVDSWSSMEADDYSKIQTEIREYFDSKSNITYRNKNGDSLTPFIAEFYIWEETKFNEICKSWMDSTVPLSKYLSFEDKELSDRILEIRNTADKLLNNANL